MTVAQFTFAARTVDLVCAHFNVSPDDLESHCREWAIVWPRWIAILLIHRHARLSSKTIGLLFNRSHGAILRALAGTADQIATDPDSNFDLCQIETALLSPPSTP